MLGVEPSAPALQQLPVAASERGAVGAVGRRGEVGLDSLQNGADTLFSHTLSGCLTQAFLFLDAYGIQLCGAQGACSPSSLPFFLLLSLSAVVLAASGAALLRSGNQKPLFAAESVRELEPARSRSRWASRIELLPPKHSAVRLALRCGWGPISVGLVRLMAKRIVQDRRKPTPGDDPSNSSQLISRSLSHPSTG